MARPSDAHIRRRTQQRTHVAEQCGGRRMNVERLHLIAVKLREDLVRSSLAQHLNALADALANLANQPGEQAYQQAVSTARDAVRDAATSSSVEEWPAAWRATLEELDLDDIVGSNLAR